MRFNSKVTPTEEKNTVSRPSMSRGRLDKSIYKELDPRVTYFKSWSKQTRELESANEKRAKLEQSSILYLHKFSLAICFL